MSTIANILANRKQKREQAKLEEKNETQKELDLRKENIQNILDFLKETEADPQYGPLLNIEISGNFKFIRIHPSEEGYKVLSNNSGGEHPDDIDLPVDIIRIEQEVSNASVGDRNWPITLWENSWVRATSTKEEEILTALQQATATLLESLLGEEE